LPGKTKMNIVFELLAGPEPSRDEGGKPGFVSWGSGKLVGSTRGGAQPKGKGGVSKQAQGLVSLAMPAARAQD